MKHIRADRSAIGGGGLCACVLAIFLAAPAAAQPPAAILGVVRDESGSPLARITVSATSIDAGVTRETVTADDGRFRLSSLRPASDYRVTVAGAGFRTFLSVQIALRAGETHPFDVVLSLGLTERLHVAAPRTGDTGAFVRQTIDEDLTRALPLIDRGFIHLASLAPGFTGRSDFPDAQGQHYWTNNIVVDGASDFSKWRGAPRSFYSGYGRESIRDVTILPQLFGANMGGALGSVTTAASRAGGRFWSGTAFLFARHTALSAPPVFAVGEPAGGTAQYGGAVGGPLSAHTFVFASYDARRSRDHNVVSSPAAPGVAVPTNQDERTAFVRFDHPFSNRQSITGRLNVQFFRWHDEPGVLTLPGSGTAYTNDAHTALFTHSLQLSDSTSQELRAEFSRYVDMRSDLSPGVFVSRAGYSLQGGVLGSSGMGVAPEQSWEVHHTLSHATASHALRIGGTVSVVHAHATSARYVRGAYYFAGEPAAAPQPYLYIQSVATGPDATIVDSRSVAATGFLQDDWRATTNVTMTAGLRYDVEQIYGMRNFAVPADTNNVQPRVAVAWRPAGSRMLVRAAAGVYTQQHVLYPIHLADLQGIGGMATVVLPLSPTGFPAFPSAQAPDLVLGAVPHDVYRMAPDFRNAYSVQAGAGVEQSFGGFTAAADYLHLNGHDLLSVIDLNAPVSIAKPAQRSVADADGTRPLAPASGYRKLLEIGNEGRSWYRALQLRVDGGAHAIRLVTSYTFAHADDQANDELPEDSRNLSAEKGRAPTDIRHNLATAIMWQAPGSHALTRGWSLAAFGIFRSSRPYTITWGDDRNGTTQNDARPDARNTGRTGPYRTIDLSISRLATAGHATFEGRVEIFNLLNTINYEEYVSALLSPLFGQPISAFPRRRGQVALVVRF